MDVSTATSYTTTNLQVGSSEVEPVFYVYVTFGILGMIGNLFVCVVMLRYRKVFNSTTNKLIIHQSFVDLLASLVFLLRRFLVISSHVPDSILGSLYCKLWWSEYVQFSMFDTSTYNMVAISVERYFATCHPISHRNTFSSRRLKIIMVAAWLCGWIPVAHLIPVTYQINDRCEISWPSPAIQALGGVFVFLQELVIPLSVMIFAYTKIILELHRRSTARVGGTNHDAPNMLSKANKNVTKTLFVVAIFFAICWTPTEVNYLLYNLGVNTNFANSAVYQAVGAIVSLNTCINPFIYCFTYDRFQRQAKTMACHGCQRSSNRVDTSDTSGSRDTAVQRIT